MKYGAYNPLYPNGIVTVASQNEIFGFRFLVADQNNHQLIDGKALDFDSIRIKPNTLDRNYDITWMLNGKQIHFSWCRISENTVYGQVEFDEGLEILAEMYIPWEDRLNKEWPNFTRQGECVFTGELISPYQTYQNNAVLFCTDKAPSEALGYNQRAEQLESFRKTGTLQSVARGTIWGDMGISWYFGAHYTEEFSFLIQNGSAEAFLKILDEPPFEELFEIGKKELKKCPINLTGNGILGEISEAISSVLPYNTIYKAHTDRRYIMVDRPWARAEDDWGIQFNWDTFLSSWSASWVDPNLAKENMLSGYDAQLPDGKIPLHIRSGKEHQAEPPITAGRSQHIVQGLSLWKTYLHIGDKEWAKICYEGAKKANAWWFADRGDGQKYRDALNWGTLGFGYDPEAEMGVLGARKQPYVAKAQYAYFETYDDSPQWTTGQYFKSVADLEMVTEEMVEDEAKYIENSAFPDQKYWRGQIWPTQTVWTYLSLKRANEPKLAWELAQKAGRMLAREWRERGFTPENYNAYTGRCSGSSHYNWGVLMGVILLEELVCFHEDKVVFGNPLAEDGTELSNILIDGYRYSLKIKDGKTIVYCNGCKVAESDDMVEITRNNSFDRPTTLYHC